MKYQLEIELPATSLDDLDILIEIESALVDSLGSQHFVDGHDFGSGRMTIFILTDFPDEAFEASIDTLQSKELLSTAQARYRDRTEEDYIIIWPQADNLSRIATTLKRLQTEGGNGNFVIFSTNAEGIYYVQFKGKNGNTSLYAESVSNKCLAPEFMLNEIQIEQLQSMGWQSPAPDDLNFYRKWQATTDEERLMIAQQVLQTLIDVYRVSSSQFLRIELVFE